MAPVRILLLAALALAAGAAPAQAGFKFGGIQGEALAPQLADRAYVIDDPGARKGKALRVHGDEAVVVPIPTDALEPGLNMMRVRARTGGCDGAHVLLAVDGAVAADAPTPANGTLGDYFFAWLAPPGASPTVLVSHSCGMTLDLDAVWFTRTSFEGDATPVQPGV